MPGGGCALYGAFDLHGDVADQVMLAGAEAAGEHQENQDDHDDIDQRRHIRTRIKVNFFCALDSHRGFS